MENLSANELRVIKDWLGTGAINIFGLPFSGKDTHGHKLAKVFGASVMGGGEILRNSTIPEHVKTIMESGALVPIDDYIAIVTPYLSSEAFTGRPLILSSVGRWHGEEEGVMGAAKAAGHPIKAAVYLHVSEATALERHQLSQEDEARGLRTDDATHLIETRFAEFRTKTLPVIEYYRQHDLLIEVDGNPPIEEVSTKILQKLLDLASR